MVFIETERLLMRNLLQSDADIMFDYRNNEACSRYQRGQTKDHDEIVKLIKRRENDAFSTEKPFMLAVALRATDEMIGEIVVIPKDGTVSLGYTLSYKYHRQGYAFEALTALTEVLHNMAPDMEFISFTDPENISSRRLLEKLGYKDMGYVPSKSSQAYGKWTTRATDEEFAEACR